MELIYNDFIHLIGFFLFQNINNEIFMIIQNPTISCYFDKNKILKLYIQCNYIIPETFLKAIVEWPDSPQILLFPIIEIFIKEDKPMIKSSIFINNFKGKHLPYNNYFPNDWENFLIVQ